MVANQVLGVRIRYFRKKNGLTQKELADALGVNDSTIRNYELGNRMPDANTLSAIAKALEVDFYTLKGADVNSIDSALHALFDIEDLYGLVPDVIDGKVCLIMDDENRFSYTDRDSDKLDSFKDVMSDWLRARQSLLCGDISEEFYSSWKEKYPGFSGIDENDIPFIPSERKQIEEARNEELKLRYDVYVSAKEWAGEKDIMDFEEFAAKAGLKKF